MQIKHEFWRMVASGLFKTLLDDLVAVTSRDARKLMLDNGAFNGKFWRACYDSLAYVVDRNSISECWNYIVDPVYNPHVRTDIPPMVVSPAVSGGNTLTTGTVPDGYTAQVYSWDFTEFALLGTLAEYSQPGVGFYVLALADDADQSVGLPSSFLELTA